MRRNKKKVALATVVIVGIAGIAYAYWTAGGSGTGTADTGTVEEVTVIQTSEVTGLAPGGAAQELAGTFDNPNSGSVYVESVTVEIASVTDSLGAVIDDCDATDYTLTGATMTVQAEVLANDTSTWGGATIAFNNKETNQNACKNATVNLAYTVS